MTTTLCYKCGNEAVHTNSIAMLGLLKVVKQDTGELVNELHNVGCTSIPLCEDCQRKLWEYLQSH